MVTDAQVRKLMNEVHKSGLLGVSALRAGMSRNTAAKYQKSGKLPSEVKALHTWRTRPDPFEEDWPWVEMMLRQHPGLEAKALFQELLERQPDRYQEGQVRTLQRRVKHWRAQEGPDKDVFFPQEHRPGEATQTDFTWATVLGVTICLQPFPHMLCHPVLPFSNWEWATVCRSESLAALKRGLQEALLRLGHVTKYHQTDNSTAATHDLATGKRGFNEDYLQMVGHFGMEPRTIAVRAKEQNGDVESLNGALKRRLQQELLLRGSSDFESVEAYESWIWQKLEKFNRPRAAKLAQELAVMRPLLASRLPDFIEVDTRVSTYSTLYIQRNVYSVPSRLIREKVLVRVYEDRLEVYHGGRLQLTMERLLGRHGHLVNYRHIIWSLVRKPGAFRLYRYRDDLFPSVIFRKAYDSLCARYDEGRACKEYVRILHLAASTVESDVEAALDLLLEEGCLRGVDQVRALVGPGNCPAGMDLAPPPVDLSIYDKLLAISMEAAS